MRGMNILRYSFTSSRPNTAYLQVRQRWELSLEVLPNWLELKPPRVMSLVLWCVNRRWDRRVQTIGWRGRHSHGMQVGGLSSKRRDRAQGCGSSANETDANYGTFEWTTVNEEVDNWGGMPSVRSKDLVVM